MYYLRTVIPDFMVIHTKLEQDIWTAMSDYVKGLSHSRIIVACSYFATDANVGSLIRCNDTAQCTFSAKGM